MLPLQIALWIFCGVTRSGDHASLARILSCTFMALVSLIAAAGFLVYGGRLFLMLRRSATIQLLIFYIHLDSDWFLSQALWSSAVLSQSSQMHVKLLVDCILSRYWSSTAIWQMAGLFQNHFFADWSQSRVRRCTKVVPKKDTGCCLKQRSIWKRLAV